MFAKSDFGECCATGFVLLLVFGAPFVKWVLQYYKMQSESAARAAARRTQPAPAPVGRRFAPTPPPPAPVPFQTRVQRREQPPVLTPVFEEEEAPLAPVGSLESRHVVGDRHVESEVVRHTEEYMQERAAPGPAQRSPPPRAEPRKRRAAPAKPRASVMARIEEEYSLAERGLIWKEILGPPPGLVRWRQRRGPAPDRR